MAFGNVFNGWKIDGISFGLSRMTDGSQMIIPWILERGNRFFFWKISLKLVGYRWKFTNLGFTNYRN